MLSVMKLSLEPHHSCLVISYLVCGHELIRSSTRVLVEVSLAKYGLEEWFSKACCLFCEATKPRSCVALFGAFQFTGYIP